MPGLFKAVNLLFSSEQKNYKRAIHLYKLTSQQARQPVFYEKLSVPDSVEGRFDLLSLHLILLMRRMPREGKLLQELFDFFFADIDRSLREMGVGDLKVGKHVKKLAKNFLGVFKAYNETFANKDALKESLNRNIYCGGCKDDEMLEIMYEYCIACDEVLSEIDLAVEDPLWANIVEEEPMTHAA